MLTVWEPSLYRTRLYHTTKPLKYPAKSHLHVRQFPLLPNLAEGADREALRDAVQHATQQLPAPHQSVGQLCLVVKDKLAGECHGEDDLCVYDSWLHLLN